MITLAILTALLVPSAMAAGIVLLRLAIAREESRSSLYNPPTTLTVAITRRVLGWHGPRSQDTAQANRQLHR
ncbi:MAG TPA: hypothetical protein VMU94_13365 [Streptosporangiaceae bacterium]|nr:hypothetical protein [Streptosporangiaceae bacterium]